MTTPKQIVRANQHDVRVVWVDEHESLYEARSLRLACPCAMCIEETTGAPLLDPSRVPLDVHPLRLNLVGRYGLSIEWSDGHSTGIYTFDQLRAQCPCPACSASRERS